MRLLTLIGLAFTLSVQAANPILFVPGWGPPSLANLKKVAAFFEKDGYPAKRLHHFSYPYKEELGAIEKKLSAKILAVVNGYPKETRFDVVTHSLGHFVALHAILESGLGGRIDHYIGLAGIGLGQNTLPVGCGISKCTSIKKLIPFPSPFALDVIKRHQIVVQSWKKCSLYSVDDNVLDDPYDASQFADGVNVSLTDYLHNDFLRSHTIYQTLRDRCGLAAK